MPEYKLYYFDYFGLAEPIRLCFAQAGVPFQDVRITAEEWLSDMKEKMTFGQVPVLDVDGKQLSQTGAILRYVGKKLGLEADSEWDEAVGDELATSWLDMAGHIQTIITETDAGARRANFEKFVDEFLNPRLTICNHRLSESKSGFIAGDKVTWSDFYFYNLLTMVIDHFKVPLSPYPALEQFRAKIESLPNIKQWQADHANSRFSLFTSILEYDYESVMRLRGKK